MTEFNQDELRLAEAMGWERTKYDRWLSPDRKMCCDFPPDPFTDANDDYAVLEWMREKCGVYLPDVGYTREQAQEFKAFGEQLDDCELYEIGDYARAALKVVERV